MKEDIGSGGDGLISASDVSSMSEHLHAIILAGGVGTRFWPLSREMSPKQFLTIFGGVSLISRAIQRIAPFVAWHGVHIVTGENLFDELRNHLKSQPELRGMAVDYIVEPTSRNTGPAIALAAAVLLEKDPEAIIVVLPSDHLLNSGAEWRNVLRVSVRLAEQNLISIVGIAPTTPETGYGYIHVGELIPGSTIGKNSGHRVLEFMEKPDLETAEGFLADGGYLWNAGMLVARASVILEELRAAGNAQKTSASSDGNGLVDVAQTLAAIPRKKWFTAGPHNLYEALPTVPFDRAVLEVSPRVVVVPASLEWSDVGSLLSIAELGEADEHGNVLIGRAYDADSQGSISYASSGRLVATLGLRDTIIVDTEDATLVTNRENAQNVSFLVKMLREAGVPEVVESRQSLRPWGSWTLLLRGVGFQVKVLEIKPGARLSLQSHAKRSEHWIIVDGTARVSRDGEDLDLHHNESVYILPGCKHRLENIGKTPLKVIEVALGDVDENDITRYQDDWVRY